MHASDLNQHERDQLAIVVLRYPVEPGDTLSHALARSLADRGLIVRGEDSCWIPTAAGIREYELFT